MRAPGVRERLPSSHSEGLCDSRGDSGAGQPTQAQQAEWMAAGLLFPAQLSKPRRPAGEPWMRALAQAG